jgi:hypothetical protein
MKITDDHEISGMEQVTRFVFGGLVGLIPGGILFAATSKEGLIAGILLLLLSILISGLLALYYGDRFWYRLSELLRLGNWL